ncbi:MAG: hypothetical protein ACHREM_05350 [Polyangiales bacterium]
MSRRLLSHRVPDVADLRLLGLMIASMAVALFGCGSSNEVVGSSEAIPVCAPFTSCGGSPFGTWTITSACLPPVSGAGACVGEGAFDTAEVSGTLTLGNDGSFTRTGTLTTTRHFVFPPGCIAKSDGTCVPELETLSLSDGYSRITCMPTQQGACACAATMMPFSLDQSGTYDFAGGTLGLRLSVEQTLSIPYCVQGDTLTLNAEDARGLPLLTLRR